MPYLSNDQRQRSEDKLDMEAQANSMIHPIIIISIKIVS